MNNILDLDNPETVKSAWYIYDIEEQELWNTYAENPNYLSGKVYIAAEDLARKKCERTVQRIRFNRSPRKELD